MLPSLFGETPSSERLRSYLQEVCSGAKTILPEPEIKAYPDAVYFNYYALGLSLLFVPTNDHVPTKAPLDYSRLLLDGIDIFNTIKSAVLSKGKTYSQYPLLPMELSTVPQLKADDDAPTSSGSFELKAETTGQDLVRAFGEPTRKGGGAGPSSGSISIWCEWSKLGIMVEFGGDEARGPQAWERGKDAKWKVITFFPPKDA